MDFMDRRRPDQADKMSARLDTRVRGLLAVEPFGERGCQGTARQSSSVQRAWDGQDLVLCYIRLHCLLCPCARREPSVRANRMPPWEWVNFEAR